MTQRLAESVRVGTIILSSRKMDLVGIVELCGLNHVVAGRSRTGSNLSGPNTRMTIDPEPYITMVEPACRLCVMAIVIAGRRRHAQGLA